MVNFEIFQIYYGAQFLIQRKHLASVDAVESHYIHSSEGPFLGAIAA